MYLSLSRQKAWACEGALTELRTCIDRGWCQNRRDGDTLQGWYPAGVGSASPSGRDSPGASSCVRRPSGSLFSDEPDPIHTHYGS
jgi:hypothetical protein